MFYGMGTVVKGDGYSSKVNVGIDARTPSASPGLIMFCGTGTVVLRWSLLLMGDGYSSYLDGHFCLCLGMEFFLKMLFFK